MLVDHMDNDGRVDVAYNANPALSEFYLEFDRRTGYPYAPEMVEGEEYFRVGDMPFDFRYPTDGALTTAHVEEARQFVQSVHDAIVARNWAQIQNLIDVPSWVDFYIVNELFKQVDIDWSSVHMTVRGTGANRRLHMGPLWDFDIAAGNAYYADNSPNGHWVAERHVWFRELVRHTPQFRNLVKERFNQVVDKNIPATVEHVQLMAEFYEEEFLRNFERWEIMGEYVWPNPPNLVAIDTFQGQVDFLTGFLTQRGEWMRSFLNG